jgi:pyrimidine deaminase RibD-like protein
VTGVILTKLDGTAKGGVAVSVVRELGVPIRYVGVGESAEDLLPFDAVAFAEGLVGAHRDAGRQGRVQRRRRALRAAGPRPGPARRGETNPNPMVGCVIVRAGRVVSEGWHRRAGGPHAEAIALSGRGRRRGSHALRQPRALLASRQAHAALRAVHRPRGDRPGGRLDGRSEPSVRGRGFRALRRAGVRVTTGVLAEEAAALNAVFVGAQRGQKPFVLLKAAMTLDGRIATPSGESKWITSPAQRGAGRRLRRDFDGVAVGLGTVTAERSAPAPEPEDPAAVLPRGLRFAPPASPGQPAGAVGPPRVSRGRGLRPCPGGPATPAGAGRRHGAEGGVARREGGHRRRA